MRIIRCARWSNRDTSTRLLEKFKVFTAFYHLSELRSREDLIKGIIENLDYNMWAAQILCSVLNLMLFSDGHPRIVLSKALTSSYKASSQSIPFTLFNDVYAAYSDVRHPTFRRTHPWFCERKCMDSATSPDTTI